MIDGVDEVRLRAYRLGRVQAELRKQDCGAIILSNPHNVRYAVGSRQAATFNLYSPSLHVVVPAEGRVTVFHQGDPHIFQSLESVGDIRPSCNWYFFEAGPRYAEKAQRWAKEVGSVIHSFTGRNGRVGVDRLDPHPTDALRGEGFSIVNGEEIMEYARVIKSADEVACIKHVLAVCETGIHRMREALQPGITENELWAVLHHTNISMGGEWIETRLLTSGPRTNPWMRSANERVIRAGDLVAFDTDLVGPHGYLADVSRTFLCPPAAATAEQRRLYSLAYQQVKHNAALLRAGLSFRELAEQSWPLPPEFVANRYVGLIHGAGMCDEYPLVPCPQDFEANGYDGEFEPGMVVCVESYIGSEGGSQGVKLEEQVIITETGCEFLSSYPFEEALLG